MRILRRGYARWWMMVLLAVVAACGSGRDLPPAVSDDVNREADAAGAFDAGGVNAGAAGDRAGSSGGSASGGDGSGVETAGSTSTDAGAPTAEPIDRACMGDRAFAVSGGAFVAPTEKPLALALNRDIFGVSPITFVLRGGDEPIVVASYSVDANGQQAFPAALATPSVAAWIRSGGFGTETAQPSGYLRVIADDGDVEIPLENLTFSVTTQQGCTRGVARLTATIPASRRDLVDKLSGGRGDGPDDPGRSAEVETPVHAVFEVELVDFDFRSGP